MTLGFHARAIPAHIREIPFTIQARFRFPMPLVNRQAESKITDWEISGGLRPAIWETSLYGHATFSFDIEAGFRSVSLDTNPQTNVNVPVTDPLTKCTFHSTIRLELEGSLAGRVSSGGGILLGLATLFAPIDPIAEKVSAQQVQRLHSG